MIDINKISKQKLINKLKHHLPNKITMINLLEYLDQIIDIVIIKLLNIEPTYLNKLIFFYGAKPPGKHFKHELIKYLKSSDLNKYIKINIRAQPKCSLLNCICMTGYYDFKIIYKDFINDILNNKQINPELKKKLKLKYPELYKLILRDRPNTFDDIEDIFEEMGRQTEPSPDTANLFQQYDNARYMLLNKSRNSFKYSDRVKLPSIVSNKTTRQKKKDKIKKNKLCRVIQEILVNYLIEYTPKYKNLTTVFLETISEIPFNKVDFRIRNRAQKKISRYRFKCPGLFTISPKDYVFQLKKSQNISTQDYVIHDSIVCSGLEPFTLKRLTSKRQEIDWWIKRLSRDDKYPNKKEKKWIYQYY